MRITVAAVVWLCSSAAASAAPEPLQPAPVPGVDAGQVAPADRAGGSSAADNQAPFAAGPTNQLSGRGQATPQNAPGTSRDTSPTPDVSR